MVGRILGTLFSRPDPKPVGIEDHPKPNWKQRFRARLRDKPCKFALHQFVWTYDGGRYFQACEHCAHRQRQGRSLLNPLAILPKPGVGAALGAMRDGPVWHVATGSLSALLAADRLYCAREWFGRFCSGQGRRLEHVSDHEALVHCDRCDRVIADVEFQTE